MEATEHSSNLRRRRRRLPISAAIALAILVVPAIALANHQFNDVPNAASYHSSVSKLVNAGIASGCAAGSYCPGNAVTRGQMAQFMTRGLGTTAGGHGQLVASEAGDFYVATVTMPPSGLSGGTGYVTVDADLSVLDLAGTCPCGVIFWIQDTATFESSAAGTMIVGGDAVDGGMANSGSVSWVFEVPTGTAVEYGIAANIFTGPAEPLGGAGGSTQGELAEPMLTGTITAEYSPFGEPTPPVFGKLGGATVGGWGGEVSPDQERRVQDR